MKSRHTDTHGKSKWQEHMAEVNKHIQRAKRIGYGECGYCHQWRPLLDGLCRGKECKEMRKVMER